MTFIRGETSSSRGTIQDRSNKRTDSCTGTVYYYSFRDTRQYEDTSLTIFAVFENAGIVAWENPDCTSIKIERL